MVSSIIIRSLKTIIPPQNVSTCTEQGMVTEYSLTVGNKVKFEVQGQNMTHGLVRMQIMITPVKGKLLHTLIPLSLCIIV